MARRSSDEATQQVFNNAVPTGVLTSLVAPDPNALISPRDFGYSGTSDGAGDIFLYYYSDLALGDEVEIYHVHFVQSQGDEFEFPQQFEVPRGSGIAVRTVDAEASASFFYVPHDVTDPITKALARNASLVPVQNPGVHANVTRAPNGRNF